MVVLALAPSVGRRASAQAPSLDSPVLGREPGSIRVTQENVRFSNYLRDLAGPGALVGMVRGSLLEEIRKHDDKELSTRIAARATRHVAEISVRDGLAAAMHRSTDYHYQFCECKGFGPRVQHALIETFTDRRADGSRALSVPRIAGAYAGGFAGLAWEHDHGVGSVAAGTTLSFGFSALFNIARELTGVGRPKSP